MIALILALIVAGSTVAPQAPQAELALTGPLRAVELVTSSGARTSVLVEVPDGQRRRLRVPLGPSGARLDTVSIEVDGRGDAELVAVELTEPAWPSALGRRGRPPVPAPTSKARGSELALLAALGLFLLASRRRPGLALGLGALGAVAFVFVPRTTEGGSVEVVEGLVESATWVRVETSGLHAGGVRIAPTDHVELDPPAAPVDWSVEERAGEAGWVVRGPLGSVTRFGAVDALEVSATRNAALDLDVAWVRQPGGAWSHHGAWPAGSDLPAARPGPDPPGWARLALPLGQSVLVGRREGGGRARWIRVVGSLPHPGDGISDGD